MITGMMTLSRRFTPILSFLVLTHNGFPSVDADRELDEINQAAATITSKSTAGQEASVDEPSNINRRKKRRLRRRSSHQQGFLQTAAAATRADGPVPESTNPALDSLTGDDGEAAQILRALKAGEKPPEFEETKKYTEAAEAASADELKGVYSEKVKDAKANVEGSLAALTEQADKAVKQGDAARAIMEVAQKLPEVLADKQLEISAQIGKTLEAAKEAHKAHTEIPKKLAAHVLEQVAKKVGEDRQQAFDAYTDTKQKHDELKKAHDDRFGAA